MVLKITIECEKCGSEGTFIPEIFGKNIKPLENVYCMMCGHKLEEGE